MSFFSNTILWCLAIGATVWALRKAVELLLRVCLRWAGIDYGCMCLFLFCCLFSSVAQVPFSSNANTLCKPPSVTFHRTPPFAVIGNSAPALPMLGGGITRVGLVRLPMRVVSLAPGDEGFSGHCGGRACVLEVTFP